MEVASPQDAPTAYWSEHKAPAAQLNCAGAVRLFPPLAVFSVWCVHATMGPVGQRWIACVPTARTLCTRGGGHGTSPAPANIYMASCTCLPCGYRFAAAGPLGNLMVQWRVRRRTRSGLHTVRFDQPCWWRRRTAGFCRPGNSSVGIALPPALYRTLRNRPTSPHLLILGL